jgi:hypothetical protein
VYPVGGWWREKVRLVRFDREARYALLVTLRVPGSDVDIYTAVASMVDTPVNIETEIEI